MTEEQRTERIEKYLNNNLHPEELAVFEKELADSLQLQSEVAEHKKANAILRYANQKQLKERLRQIDRESAQTPRRRFLRTIAIAASVLVLIAFGVYMTTWSDTGADKQLSMSAEELAIEFFSPATTTQMRGTKPDPMTYSSRLAQADLLFKAGDFSESAKTYELLSKESHPQSEKAEWNMALARMAVDDSRYLDDLERIGQNPAHMFHGKAKDLLDLLETR